MEFYINDLNVLLDKLDKLTWTWVPDSCKAHVSTDIANVHSEIQNLFRQITESK